MEKYTVIGFYEETHQIFCHHVEARNSQHAFYVVATDFPEANFIVAIKGHLTEGRDDIEFPGTSTVDAATVLEQSDVFNV